MSHTKTVLVSNDDAESSTTVGAGLLVGFVNDTATGSGSFAALAAGTKYQFMTAEASTPRFDGADLVAGSGSVAVYSAGVGQTATIALVAASTYARDADDTYSLKLIDVTDGRQQFAIKTFQTAAYTTDQVGTVIVAAFEELIDAEGLLVDSPFYGVTSEDTTTSGTLVITNAIDKVLRVAGSDSLAAASYAGPTMSVGTPAKVNAEVQAALGFQGVTNIAGPNTVKPAVVTAGDTYQRFAFQLATTVGDREDIHEIVFYIGHDNTELNADLDTLLSVA